MRILIIMDPGIKVPPNGYGGHERLVEMFAKEYLLQGHSVDLLVTEGSKVDGCNVYSIGPEGFPSSRKVRYLSILIAWRFLFVRGGNYDKIHNFGRLMYLLPILNSRVKKIMTYGREINSRNIRLINYLPNQNLIFTGCSKDLIDRVNASGNWHAVYNAIPFDRYKPNLISSDKNPLVFLGRLERIKGVHTAIEVALQTNSELIIAGNISNLLEEKKYFEKEIAPKIDGNQIKYIGAVNDIQKNDLLRNARALLFPIEWNEPFGMVMVEAMACGTPVIAFKRGSVNEVIDEGITGFKVENTAQLIEKVINISDIDRKECVIHARNRFHTSVIAKEYLSLFE